MIQYIETFLLDVPTIRPHKLSVATMNTQTLVLVRIRCADGATGWGEATTIGGFRTLCVSTKTRAVLWYSLGRE